MKKVLSVLIAVTMILSLATFSFATSERITGAIKPIDTNDNPSLEDRKPGDKVQYTLTQDMFSWKSGKTGLATDPVTKSDISSGSVKVVISGTESSVVKSTSIKYVKSNITGGKETAVVEVEFVKPLASLTEKTFKFNMFLSVSGNRQQNSRVTVEGSVKNEEVTVNSGDIDAYLDSGKVLVVNSSIRNLEISLGEKVYMVLNVFPGQKYYGYATNNITSKDQGVIGKNPSISDVIHLETINLNRTGKYVNVSDYGTGYVYNESGKYIGKTADMLEYSATYYISNKDLGTGLAGATSGGGSTTTTPPPTTTTPPATKPPTTTTPPASSAKGTIEKTEATTLVNAAIKSASGKTATVTVKNKSAITAEALKAMSTAGANAGKGVSLISDSTSGNAVVGRLYINPANAKNLTGTITISTSVNNSNVEKAKAMFTKSFKNNIAVFSFDQDNTFGMPVEVAAKVDLSKLNKNNIYFYSYNRATKKYYRIEKPNASVDNSGYLRFTTTLAGDIIISDGALVKK